MSIAVELLGRLRLWSYRASCGFKRRQRLLSGPAVPHVIKMYYGWGLRRASTQVLLLLYFLKFLLKLPIRSEKQRTSDTQQAEMISTELALPVNV